MKVTVVSAVLLFTLFVGVSCTLEISPKAKSTEIKIPPSDDIVCMARYVVHNSSKFVEQTHREHRASISHHVLTSSKFFQM